jgi:hypothetical protein
VREDRAHRRALRERRDHPKPSTAARTLQRVDVIHAPEQVRPRRSGRVAREVVPGVAVARRAQLCLGTRSSHRGGQALRRSRGLHAHRRAHARRAGDALHHHRRARAEAPRATRSRPRPRRRARCARPSLARPHAAAQTSTLPRAKTFGAKRRSLRAVRGSARGHPSRRPTQPPTTTASPAGSERPA